MMEKKQSSVEWLLNNLLINGFLRLNIDELKLYKELKEQAKAMHEEEHTKAYIEGGKSIMHGVVSSPEGLIAKSEIYYNETFKNE